MSLQEFLPTPTFEEYSEFFKDFFTMSRREDGVLLVQAHTVGGPIQLSVENHRALGQMLKVVGADPENEILILTGTGDEFMMRSDPEGFAIEEEDLDYWAYEYAYKDGRINVSSLVNDLEIPTIGAGERPGIPHRDLTDVRHHHRRGRRRAVRPALRHRLRPWRRHPQLPSRNCSASSAPPTRCSPAEAIDAQQGAGVRPGQRGRPGRGADRPRLRDRRPHHDPAADDRGG